MTTETTDNTQATEDSQKSSPNQKLPHLDPLLTVKDLCVNFSVQGRTLKAIRNVGLSVNKGEILALVGESGSGKSVLTKAITGMLDQNAYLPQGQITFQGQDLTRFSSPQDWLSIRGKKIAMIFQDPMTALNPLKTIGAHLSEVITLHRGVQGIEAKNIALAMLQRVGITDPTRRYIQYPHEFSGGMRQRVVIAIAAACMPDLLICDEPTTALDLTIQAQILSLLDGLQREHNMGIIFITHDLGVVAKLAHRVAVMYAGEIVEIGSTQDIFYNPQHPYTWSLLASLPQLALKGEELYSIPGNPPSLYHEIKGDAFAPRNPWALAIDYEEAPPWFDVAPGHRAKTWLLHPLAPKITPPQTIARLREGYYKQGQRT